MTVKSALVAQFRRPRGPLGALAGAVMATRPSNRLRNARTVGVLQLRPESRVLEIGCGPGLAVSRCAGIVSRGRIVGLDHSAVMIRQARRRLARQGLAGRVELVEGGLDRLRGWPDSFDRVFSLNVIQFQRDKLAFYRAIHGTLVAGGLCLTTYQPRLRGDGAAALRETLAAIRGALAGAGFDIVAEAEITGGNRPCTCVIGRALPLPAARGG